MAYFKPYIDGAGLHIPSYNDIRDNIAEQFKTIYGQDIYLGNDSQDYQMISIFASMMYDTAQLLQIVYNNRSPKTAVGTALDSIVKLNGIKRKSASYSTVTLTLTGNVGTVISNGIAQDEQGNNWYLLDSIVFDNKIMNVSARCGLIGAVEAQADTITKIMTPTRGWTSVNNDVAAIPGAPVESDLQLRERQSISVATPSQSMVDSVIAAIAAIDNVKKFKVYENYTNIVDENGIPGHSLACVVDGGFDELIAKSIYMGKGIGCGTYGSSTYNIINSDSTSMAINYSRPEKVPVFIIAEIKPLSGYKDIKDSINNALTEYITGLDIGSDVIYGVLESIIFNTNVNIYRPTFKLNHLKIGTSAFPVDRQDLPMTYDQVAVVGKMLVLEV